MARPVSPRGQGRARVVDAALELFAEHGVSGTSLQMIADHLGVTKAAVYYQFNAKEDIVAAVVEPAFGQLRTIVETADAAADADVAATIALKGIVDLIIDHRKVVATLYRDPEVERFVESHPEFRRLTEQLGLFLVGRHPDTRRLVVVSVLGAGLANAGTDPQLAAVDDETLRTELLSLGRAMLTSAWDPHTTPSR